MAPPANMGELVAQVDLLVRDREFATLGQRIVIVAGAALGTPGTLNGILVHTLGEETSNLPAVPTILEIGRP
jgi:hypothetical protein